MRILPAAVALPHVALRADPHRNGADVDRPHSSPATGIMGCLVGKPVAVEDRAIQRQGPGSQTTCWRVVTDRRDLVSHETKRLTTASFAKRCQGAHSRCTALRHKSREGIIS
jgi:hypothetical protein